MGEALIARRGGGGKKEEKLIASIKVTGTASTMVDMSEYSWDNVQYIRIEMSGTWYSTQSGYSYGYIHTKDQAGNFIMYAMVQDMAYQTVGTVTFGDGGNDPYICYVEALFDKFTPRHLLTVRGRIKSTASPSITSSTETVEQWAGILGQKVYFTTEYTNGRDMNADVNIYIMPK